MQRINLLTLCEWYHKIHKLRDLHEHSSKYTQALATYEAAVALRAFLQSTEFPIPISLEKGKILLVNLENLMHPLLESTMGTEKQKDEETKLTQEIADHRSAMSESFRKFEQSLATELPEMDTYLLPQQGVYSIKALLAMNNHIFDEPTRKKLPTRALADLKAAGECLAFDLYTACGFHILRAAESVIKAYLPVAGREPEEIAKAKSWANYADLLRPSEDPEIVQLIDAIKQYYRNPIMHPDMTLNQQQADNVFSLCKSLIYTIAQKLPSSDEQLA